MSCIGVLASVTVAGSVCEPFLTGIWEIFLDLDQNFTVGVNVQLLNCSRKQFIRIYIHNPQISCDYSPQIINCSFGHFFQSLFFLLAFLE